MNQKQFGLWAEDLALDFFLQTRFELVAKNFRIKSGEIDLIMRKANQLHFIEVKASRQDFEPGLAITPTKQKQIHRVAKVFMTQFPEWSHLSAQFDALLVEKFPIDLKIRYYPNAFIPVVLNYF